MSSQKWGESFLKSGFPLEHATLLSINSLDWECELHHEYQRNNREGELKWFESDIIAYSPNNDMRLMIECKYHDPSRLWFFLPCTTVDHTAQYGALSAGENMETNRRVLNFAPYEALKQPDSDTLLSLAPKSVWGVTLSQDGQRQPNKVSEAIHQLTYGFVPYCLDNFYSFNISHPVAFVPVIVTSSQLYRLKPHIRDFALIREATEPGDIADNIPWTWCYHAPKNDLLYANLDSIDEHKAKYEWVEQSIIEDQLLNLWTSPSWIAVIQYDAVATAIASIYEHFTALERDYSHNDIIDKMSQLKRHHKQKSNE